MYKNKGINYNLNIKLILKLSFNRGYDFYFKKGYHSQQSREAMKKNIEIDNIEFQQLLIQAHPTKGY